MLPSGEYGALSYDGVKPYHDFSYPTATLLQLKKGESRNRNARLLQKKSKTNEGFGYRGEMHDCD